MRPRTFVVTLLIALLGVSVANADDRRAQLSALKKRIQSVQHDLNQQIEKRSSEQKALRKIETTLGKLQLDLRNTGKALQLQKQKLEQLNRRKSELTIQRSKQQHLIEQQILAAYQLGQEKKLKMMLNQESPDTLSRTLVYYDYFNRARAEQVEQYRKTIVELDALTPAIEQQTLALDNTRQTLQKQKDQLAEQQNQRQQTLASLNRKISSRDQELQGMKAEQDNLLKLLQAIEEEVANISLPESYSPFSSRRGKMPWPVQGKHLNRFGSRRNDSSLTWNGIQIATTEGSEVHAIHHGRVVFADWLRGAGLLIIIDHGGGYMSLYGHNESLLHETGDWVKAGDPIATVGNSGGRDQAALYFEVRKNGRPSNPSLWCKG